MSDYIAIPYRVCYNMEKERTWNMLFDEHFRISDVHEMGEKFTEVRP